MVTSDPCYLLRILDTGAPYFVADKMRPGITDVTLRLYLVGKSCGEHVKKWDEGRLSMQPIGTVKGASAYIGWSGWREFAG